MMGCTQASGSPVGIFDLDGTLVDTWSDTYLALTNFLENEYAEQKLRAYAEPDAASLGAADLLRRSGVASPNPEAVTAFRACLAEVIGERMSVYPGVIDLLDQAASDGWRLGVATNKPDHLAHLVLDRAGLAHYFEVVVGSTRARLKPDPDSLTQCLGDSDPGLAVMIGDTFPDVEAAAAAGLRLAVWVGGPEASSSDIEVITVESIQDVEPKALEAILVDGRE